MVLGVPAYSIHMELLPDLVPVQNYDCDMQDSIDSTSHARFLIFPADL
jgi:hypothetical protein